LSGKRARAFVDRIAAVEILQSFLAKSGRKP
jgi:RNase H-fold protein (predicted Holliday junction resolvase)